MTVPGSVAAETSLVEQIVTAPRLNDAALAALRVHAWLEELDGAERTGVWPQAQQSPLNCERSGHRAEHLDQIEAALRA